jgi:uncharacterized protein YecE (DUF72 family)
MAIRTGISSWADRSLVASGFYPKGTKPEARLSYYASQFSLVENDSAYYALPPIDQAEAWAVRTPPHFTINVKAFALLTGHYSEPARLPEDLRRALPEPVQQKPRIYANDLDSLGMSEVARRFCDSIAPLRRHDRLGLVLFQYPVWFAWSHDHETILENLHRVVPDARLAVEFRNRTWMSDRHRDRTIALLRSNQLVYTCVDEPQGYSSSVPPIAEATSDVALIRFHGRSGARWNQSHTSASERFQYLYTMSELSEWVPKVRDLADRAREVHVIMNNCYQDYAIVNARQMRTLLDASHPQASHCG